LGKWGCGTWQVPSLLLLLLLQAHQWFGDLVTLDDWTELWLNEGFATYFEVVAADAYRPSWGYFDGFLESFTSPGACHLPEVKLKGLQAQLWLQTAQTFT
jgi:hypothetical protein